MPKNSEFRYLGVLFTSDGTMKQEMRSLVWCGSCRNVGVLTETRFSFKTEASVQTNVQSHFCPAHRKLMSFTILLEKGNHKSVLMLYRPTPVVVG